MIPLVHLSPNHTYKEVVMITYSCGQKRWVKTKEGKIKLFPEKIICHTHASPEAIKEIEKYARIIFKKDRNSILCTLWRKRYRDLCRKYNLTDCF